LPDADEPDDLGELIAEVQRMQEQLVDAQAEIAGHVVEGTSGGGAVRVTVSGALEFQRVDIDESAVDPTDIPLLEDLVLAALNDAMDKVNRLNRTTIGSLESSVGNLGDLDLGGMSIGEIASRALGGLGGGELGDLGDLSGLAGLRGLDLGALGALAGGALDEDEEAEGDDEPDQGLDSGDDPPEHEER
jgi:DNA-binding YbaB/EbfC family protein